MPSVPVQIGASIQDGGWSCDVNTCAIPGPSRFFSSVLMWISENDTETLVWMGALFPFLEVNSFMSDGLGQE